MANTGRLGSITPGATTNKTLYKPGAGLVAAGLVLNICNRNSSDVSVRVAVVQNAATDPAPTNGEYVLYDRLIKAKGDASFADALQLTGLCLANANNDQIVVYASTTGVDFVVTGIEEAA